MTRGSLTHMAEVSERDLEMLEFERLRWKYLGAKETAIRDRFNMSATRYHQVLTVLIDRPEAAAYDPQLVNRSLHLREQRRHQRSPRHLRG